MTTATNNNLIDLTKKVSIILEKKQLNNIKAQVGFAIDISGSMQGLYNNGTVQEAVNRVQAVAVKFDDNETLDMWTFNERSQALEGATPSLFGTYVQKHIIGDSKVDKWGGTNYAPVLENIMEHYFSAPAKPASGFFGGLFGKTAPAAPAATTVDLPVFVVVLTDGDNDDRDATRRLVKEAQNKNIYFQFVGIGRGTTFSFIRELGDEFGNVGFVAIPDLERTSDDDLYNGLLNDEFVGWAKTHK